MAETTASSSSQSEAEREEMLDRMLTRLALADDSQLQPLLPRILPFSISSLSSPSPSLRKMVMEILSHVNKRVKHRPEIGLPLTELWNTYRDAGASPMVRNFCIVYIEMAFDRSPNEEKANMAPEILADVAKLPPQHQDIILRTVAKVIGDCHSNRVDENIGIKYKTLGNARAGQLFIDFCLHTILYRPPPAGVGCPAGLSVAQSDRVTGKVTLDGDILLMRKIGILNVFEAMQLAPELVYPIYLAASSDSQEPVAKKGEELLKRKAAGVNLDDSHLISRLFLLFNGTVGVESIAVESRVTPGNPALRARLMSVFCRSITAANSFPSTLQCIFGCIYGTGTTSRLKQLGMEFTVWVFKHAVLDQLKLMGPVILGGILKSLDSSSVGESERGARDTKTFSFQAIGLLASRMPNLFRDKIDMAVRLFTALKLEDQSLRLTIQESVTSLAIAYKDASSIVVSLVTVIVQGKSNLALMILDAIESPGAPASVLKDLEAHLLESSQVEQSEVRFCAMRWATTLFDLQHCPSRYICMLGAADPKLDIREMALEGLYLMKEQEQTISTISDVEYPELRKMLDYIFNQQPKLLESTELREEKLLFQSKAYVAMIKFLIKCFKADSMVVDSVIETNEFNSSMEMMFLILEHAMAFEGSVELHGTATKALVEIGSHFPELVAMHYAERLSWLKQFLSHIDLETRESAARLLGIACSVASVTAVSALIAELDSSISGTQTLRFENRHGALCAIGYVVAECMKEKPTISEALLESTINHLVNLVESEGAALASIGMEALGHIGLRCSLPKLVRNSISVGILEILHERLGKIIAGDDIKAIQKIVISLGHMSVKESSISDLNIALDLIFSLCRSKVEDVLFAAGEALSFLWGSVPVTADAILKSNYSSLSQSSNYLTSEMPSFSLRSNLLESNASEEPHVIVRDIITRKLFDVLLFSSRKEERCAGTVWLVSLTMYCGHHPKIQQLLPEIQEAFSHLLGDQNDLTQELASQGMSIVYELGDPSMKQDLVNALVNTLTGSGKRKRAIKLMEDSEVFQEGTIGGSPSGGKLSTYKELCSLANEMGQPDLIYKFMDLANYQAALNSKRGAAFGFSKIAKQAGDALKPHLCSLVPRLVRYQYDPDKNIQDAMGHIWRSIVADPKRTIDEYFDLIVDDLIMQSGSRLWRSREASCLALADIIQGRKFSQVSKHLKRIWSAAFRAMDDIKETVRNSGDSLCRAVSSLTIRLCDISLTAESDAKETMAIVLPFLLVEGIVSKVSTIQKASISLVMKLAKGAGTAIRPHLPDLVCCMLECLSSLEDQRLNYVELHAANVGIHAEKLENLRIAVAKDSAMWETLDLCLKVVDTHSLDLLVPRLAQLVRSGVGLNTSIDNLPKLVEDIVQTSISTGPKGAMRLAQGIQAVIGVGGEWLSDVSKTMNSSAVLPAQTQFGPLSPLYLRKLFERMGATYIKLGQFVASAPTLFPAEYVEEFQNCFDRAPAVPFSKIEAILVEELGRPIDSVYEYVDPVPIASASIAQVHGARLKNSQQEVVIKVLKPGIEDILVADLNFVYVVARILEFLNPELRRTSLVGIVKDIKESMLEEVDFRKEARNIESFRRYLENMGLSRQAKAPMVYQHCSTQHVLTMERLYGVPLTDLDSIRSLVPDPEVALVTALNVWFGSLISCDTFHADVHAGNLWLLRDGRIGFLDFGIVGRISPKTWAAMEIFLSSFATEDYEAMALALVDMGATEKNVDVKAFARDLEKIFSSIQDLDTEIVVATARSPSAAAISANVVVDERQMNALFLDVIRVSESYGLRFPREFALLMKQLLYFDRYTRLLAPNMNMLQDQRIVIVSNRRMKRLQNY